MIQTIQNTFYCKGKTAYASQQAGLSLTPVNSPHQFQPELLRLLFTVRLHVQMNLAGLALCRLSLGGPGSVVPSTIHF